MHHALHIDEILVNIFSCCHTPVHRWLRPAGQHHCHPNAPLVALARTCKAFKEPALDMVWAELEDLSPLVRCLPRELWVNKPEFGVCSLKKCLEQTEWDVIISYARRVRALPCLRSSFGLATNCIKALSEPPVSLEYIFPNLRTIGLCGPSSITLPLVRHLTNPKVKEISLEHSDTLGAVINAFGEGCPHVTDFHVSKWAHEDTVSGLVCQWHNLRSLRCSNVVLSAHALVHLSRLRNLHHISFQVHDAVADRLHTSPLTFPTLRELYLCAPLLTPIWRLFHHLHLPMVENFYVDLTQAVGPTESDLMSFFVALQGACTGTSLKNFLLHANAYDTIPSRTVSMKNSPSHYITFDHLRRLTDFVHIQTLTLHIPCRVDLNEHELLTLASSWPHLETFAISEDYDWTPSSALTPGGFVQLLEKCRLLRTFSFKMDTRGYTSIPQGHPWHGLSMRQKVFLNLLNSPVEEASVEALGFFFQAAPFPNFELAHHWDIHYFGGRRSRDAELCELYHNRWERVYALARDHWTKRKELRRAIET